MVDSRSFGQDTGKRLRPWFGQSHQTHSQDGREQIPYQRIPTGTTCREALSDIVALDSRAPDAAMMELMDDARVVRKLNDVMDVIDEEMTWLSQLSPAVFAKLGSAISIRAEAYVLV